MMMMMNRYFPQTLFWSNVEVELCRQCQVNFLCHLCNSLFASYLQFESYKQKFMKRCNTFRTTIFESCTIPAALNSKLPHVFLSHADVDLLS